MGQQNKESSKVFVLGSFNDDDGDGDGDGDGNEIIKKIRGTQREYSWKPLKHSIVERIVVLKR